MVRLVVPQSSSNNANTPARRNHIRRAQRAKGWKNYRQRQNLPPGQQQRRSRTGWDLWRYLWITRTKSNDWKAAGRAWRSLTPESRAWWVAKAVTDNGF